MVEIWKDITHNANGELVDFTGLYQVSNLGRVRSVDRTVYYSDGRIHPHKGRLLSTVKRKRDGYEYVSLYKNGMYYIVKVHRLVAEAFIPNIDNKPQIDHVDRVRNNNIVTNLRWATIEENSKNKTKRKNK